MRFTGYIGRYKLLKNYKLHANERASFANEVPSSENIKTTLDAQKSALLQRLQNANDNERASFANEAPSSENIKTTLDAQKSALLQRLQNANDKYEEFVGLTDVQAAQRKVKEAESVFLEARSKERTVLREMVVTREKLRNVRERLSHVDYSNTMYLQLASEQHELVNQEEKQKRDLEEVEDLERDSFLDLSNAMRESYEQERARVERTKYWSIIGTVIGTFIGMMGSIYMNRVRTKDLMKAVKESGSKEDFATKIETLTTANEEQRIAFTSALNTLSENLAEMSNALQVQNLQVMAGFVNESLTEGQNKLVPQNTQQNQKPLSIPLKALTDELSSYNVALTSLAKAVTALSQAENLPATGSKSSTEIELLLQKQIKTISLLHAKLDEIVSSANKLGMADLSSQLKDINLKLSSLVISPVLSSENEISPVIRELPSEEMAALKEPNFGVGIKDVVLWGSVLCCLYMFVNF